MEENSASQNAQNPSSQQNRENPVHSPEDTKDIEDNKLLAVLSYLGILCLVPLLVKKDSKFAQFHAKQGLVLMLVWFVSSFVIWFPVFGWLWGLFLLVVNIIAIVKVVTGEYWEIPGVKNVVKKLNL